MRSNYQKGELLIYRHVYQQDFRFCVYIGPSPSSTSPFSNPLFPHRVFFIDVQLFGRVMSVELTQP